MTNAAVQRWSWWSGVSPVGVRSGLANYTGGLAAAVARAGVDVRGVGLGQTGDVGGVTWAGVEAEPRNRGRALLSLDPYIANRLDVDAHARALDAELDLAPDVVVIDHLMAAWALDRACVWRSRTGGQVIHISHNDEELVRTKWAADTALLSPRGLYLRFDGWRNKRLQRRVLDTVDLTTAITSDDATSMSARHQMLKSIVVTPGYSGSLEASLPPADQRPRSVLLFGSLDWEAKRQNVIEVVQALDAPLADVGIKLRVVGGGADEFVASQQGKWSATTFVGAVDDLAAEFGQNRLGLIAEPVGGGFKLKSLDYVMAGLPMLVLDGSMSGLGLDPNRHYGSAPTVADLGAAIIDVIDDPIRLNQWASHARSAVAGRFDWSDRGSELVSAAISLRLRE